MIAVVVRIRYVSPADGVENFYFNVFTRLVRHDKVQGQEENVRAHVGILRRIRLWIDEPDNVAAALYQEQNVAIRTG